jgi:hypothetical protein
MRGNGSRKLAPLSPGQAVRFSIDNQFRAEILRRAVGRKHLQPVVLVDRIPHASPSGHNRVGEEPTSSSLGQLIQNTICDKCHEFSQFGVQVWIVMQEKGQGLSDLHFRRLGL